MSQMLEVLYKAPPDEGRENRMSKLVVPYRGRMTYREAEARPEGRITLTFEFEDEVEACRAARTLRDAGEFVEGPSEYGD